MHVYTPHRNIGAQKNCLKLKGYNFGPEWQALIGDMAKWTGNFAWGK
jgi:hypothetical protein